MPPSSKPTDERSPCGGAPTIGWASRTRSPSCVCSGGSPNKRPWRSTGRSLRFAALQLGADAEKIHAYARRQQTVSEHQQRIGEYLRLRTFDTTASERLARFLEDEALRLDRTASLLARARGWLRDEHVLAPADSVLRRAVGAARHKARALLTQRMTESLSASMRDRLDELVAVGDDHPHSPLYGIKTGTSSPSVGGMKRLLARLESIEATGVLDIDVSWVNGNYQRILFHSVRTASADRRPGARDGGPASPPRAGVLSAPGVARHARPGRRHVRQAPRPQSEAGRRTPRRHAQGATPRRRPDRSTLPPARRRAARF